MSDIYSVCASKLRFVLLRQTNCRTFRLSGRRTTLNEQAKKDTVFEAILFKPSFLSIQIVFIDEDMA